jgi:hypothetical protein
MSMHGNPVGALFKKHPKRVFFESASASQTLHLNFIEGDIERLFIFYESWIISILG